MATATSYDAVTYPSLLFRQSGPDHLAVVARLHGIAAPAVETARVLHIGGGDGLDAIALAAAYPRSQFVNFDLAAQPIARGQHWSDAAGLTNVRHLVLDIMEAADRLDGPFDYIVAHGVYAWVPDVVRDAVMPLIRHLLSPTGVAFVSYNALPGGYGRMAVRDMMLHQVGHIADPAAQIAAAKALLREFVTPGQDDAPSTTVMRREAAVALTYADGLLYHDQLNGCYAPQSLSAVVSAAEKAGLRYLGDARSGGLEHGFVNPDRAAISDAALVRHLQTQDYRTGRYFRTSLLVRADLSFSRAIESEAARGMWVATQARQSGANSFTANERALTVADSRQAKLLADLIGRGAGWHPVESLATAGDALAALCRWAVEGFVELHTTPPPFAPTVAERPTASPLARLHATDPTSRIATLDHRLIAMDDPDERSLLRRLDGSTSLAMLEPFWRSTRRGGQNSLDAALRAFAANRLLLPPMTP